MINIRCSHLPRIMACPQSRFKADIDINEESDAASLGSAIHEALAVMVKGETLPNFDLIAEKYAVKDKDEFTRLYFWAKKAWDNVSHLLTVTAIEKELNVRSQNFNLTGSPDIIALENEHTLVVWDWKTGYMESDYSAQLLGYLMLADESNDYQSYKAITAYVRQGYLDVKEYHEEDLIQFENKLIDACTSDRYSPGNACTFCGRRYDCEARHQLVRSTALDLSFGEFKDLTPETVDKTWDKVILVEKAVALYKEQVKELVKKHGAIRLDGARELAMTERNTTKIDFQKAIDVLGSELVFKAAKVNNGDLEDAVKEKARAEKEAGNKGIKIGQAWKDAKTTLEESGAITKSTSEFMMVRKIVKEETK